MKKVLSVLLMLVVVLTSITGCIIASASEINDDNFMKVVTKGDTDGNGVVDTTDIIIIKRHILNIKLLSDEFFAAADLDNNGKIDSTDYIIEKRIILGLYSFEDLNKSFYITPITDEIFARIYGKSFKEECTLPREDLRYLHVLHKDLDGVEHEGEMIVNYHIAEDVLDILKKLYEADYPIEKIRLVDEYDADDEASMEDNNSSAFNFRFISHTTRVSKHGLGLAVDINTLYNPYTKVVNGERIIEPITAEPYLDREADFPYKIDENDLCYKLFIEKGFEWGGAWEDRKDYQHFEIPTEIIAKWYPDNQ